MNLVTERDGPLTVITLNRPSVKNAVDIATAGQLLEAIEQFEAEEDAKVAILTGADGTFCAGYDLKSLSGKNPGDFYDAEGDGPMGPSRRLISKPLIGAIEGHAVAGGLELALLCDMRVASETAVFGVFCRRWGVPLIDGGNVRLPRIVGQGRALDMILTGRPVEAREAFEWGLANRLVPAGRALETAKELGRQIAKFPELCMRTDRMTAYRQWDFPLVEALKYEGREGEAPLMQGAVEGAGRFAGGKGRGGDFGDI